MMSSDRYRISLRITHPTIDSKKISKELGLTPKIAYTVGDKKLTPKGSEIPGIRKESFWCYELPVTDMQVASAISDFTVRLAKKKAFLESVVETGGRLEYFIGWFTVGNSGFDLTPSLLGQLADVGIGLCFDIYPPN